MNWDTNRLFRPGKQALRNTKKRAFSVGWNAFYVFFEKLRRPAMKPGPRSYLLLSPSPTPVPHTPTNVFRQPGKSLPPSRSPCPRPIQHMGKNRVANQICNPVLLFCGRKGNRTFPEIRRISVCYTLTLIQVHRIAHSRFSSFYPVLHLVKTKLEINLKKIKQLKHQFLIFHTSYYSVRHDLFS